MRRIKPAAPRTAMLAAVMAVLAACTALDPYPTAPAAPEPGVPQPPGMRVAICANPLKSSHVQVRDEAQQECPAGTEAKLDRTDYYLINCPMLLPARASFVCTPKK
jgi:hypothetical protein